MIASSVAMLPAERAWACSCVHGDPATELREAEAAFVGVGVRASGDSVTFRVEHDLMGNLPGVIVVHGRGDGASCGFADADVPQGFLLSVEDGALRSNLCLERDPDILLAAASTPDPDGRGPVRFLVGGIVEGHRLLALDRRGRTLAYGAGDGATVSLSVCPGERFVVEGVDDGRGILAVRRLRTFEVVRETPIVDTRLNPDIRDVRCLDEDANHIVAVHHGLGVDVGATIAVVEDGVARDTFSAARSSILLGPRSAFVSPYEGGQTLDVVDPATGRGLRRFELPRSAMPHAVSPSERFVVGLARVAGGRGVFLLDLESGRVSTRAFDDRPSGELRWLDDDRFAYLPSDVPGPGLVLDVRLRVVGSIGRWSTVDALATPSLVAGVGWGSLMTATVPDGRARVVRRFISRLTYTLALVEGDVRPTGSLLPPAATSGEALDLEPPSSGSPMVALGVLAGLVAAGGAIAFVGRRRRRATHYA